MVAYKSDPLGLNDTVVTQHKRIRNSARNGKANKLKKKKGSATTTAATKDPPAVDTNLESVTITTPPCCPDCKLPAKQTTASSQLHQQAPVSDVAPVERNTTESSGVDATLAAPTTEYKSPRPKRGECKDGCCDNNSAVTTGTRTPDDYLPKKNRLQLWCFPNGENREFLDNQKLLSIAFVSFLLFTIAQLVASFAAHSKAMIGDTSAMFIDCITYLTNYIAERRKNHFDLTYQPPAGVSPERAQFLYERAQRKLVLTWEFIPPLVSVISLMGVTAYVLADSIRVLILDFTTRPLALQEEPNLRLMLSFSCINLFIDIINVTCFALAKHFCGYTATPHAHFHTHASASITRKFIPSQDVEDGQTKEATGDEETDDKKVILNDAQVENVDAEMNESVAVPCNDSHGSSNLNMCSAYTHVLADTMRSIAVIVAALLALLVPAITAEAADSAAAVIVSFVIIMTVVPLIRGLWVTHRELQQIRAEEKEE